LRKHGIRIKPQRQPFEILQTLLLEFFADDYTAWVLKQLLDGVVETVIEINESIRAPDSLGRICPCWP